jgi:hypothetical protein
MATIRLLCVGSCGDLQPDLTILLEFQRRGHSVQLIGSINFEAMTMAISMGAIADNPSSANGPGSSSRCLPAKMKSPMLWPRLIKDGIKEWASTGCASRQAFQTF